MVVAVLGHRGMLGSVVAKFLREQGITVTTSTARWDHKAYAFVLDADYVIDCIKDPAGDAERVRWLAKRTKLIVPSTDAIVEDTPYARDKRRVEKAPAVVIRSGIIDVDRQHDPAFTDWMCDPLTPLEWVRAAWARRGLPPRVYPLGRATVDRWTIACHVARIWGRPLPKPASGAPLGRVVVGEPMYGWVGDALEEYHEWLRS